MTRAGTGRIARGFLFTSILFVAGLALGQHGTPVEDGGELATVARLGGTLHPPGMPLLALLLRISWLAGERGPAVLAALCAAASLHLLFRRAGPAGFAMSLAVLTMPAFRERVLAWDAYGPLFLLFSIAVATVRPASVTSGYLTGLALAVHPWGILLPVAAGGRWRAPILFLCGLALGASMYLALPLLSASGAAVDWGSPGTLARFLGQVSAAGYREVYGAAMGHFEIDSVSRHLSSLWSMLWPAFLLPVAAGAALLLRSRSHRLVRLAVLAGLDLLLTVFVNPMASGTSQTAWLTLMVFCALAAEAALLMPRTAVLAMAGAVAVSSLLGRTAPLPDQGDDVRSFISDAPLDAGLFISDNDRLYGCWMEKYVRDSRPDMVLLSTGNFSPWFERLAGRYNHDLDTSGGLNEAGGPGTPRDVVVSRLVRMTIENNPRRRFYSDI